MSRELSMAQSWNRMLCGLVGVALLSALAWGEAGALHCIDAKSARGLRELFRYEGEGLPVVSAHRGGPGRGYPENCIATFEETLRHTYAIMEVDPRYTRDGVLVLNHDPGLERTTTGKGRVADYTLAELKQLRLKDGEGKATELRICTLDEAMEWARGKTILVLDQKDVPVAQRVRKIEEHQAEAFAIVIVYSFKEAKECHGLNKNVMMEVMIPSREKAEEFEKTGVPWGNVVAFVGHTPPKDRGVCDLLHGKGVSCWVGSSRNVDRELIEGRVKEIGACEAGYRALLGIGADLIETDLPREVGELLYGGAKIPEGKKAFFVKR